MLDKTFIDQYQKAKVTVEVGDYRVTMEGEMKAPIKHDQYNDEFRFSEDSTFRDVETTIDMTIRHPKNIKVEQWRWTIPVAIKPRVEK